MPRGFPEQFQYVDLSFPINGIDRTRGYSVQRKGTTPIGNNVRAFGPDGNRARGGSRPALAKYVSTRPGGAAATIQDLACLVGVGYTDPGGEAQSTAQGRIVNLVAVAGGAVYVLSAGGTSWVTAGGSGTLASSGVIYSTSLNQKLYFADGANWTYYDPSLNQKLTLTASAGTLPAHGSNTPRLITTWRGRLVVSGISTDPQNWFMSKVLDPTNWNYFPDTVTVDQAIAGNNSALGKVGAPVTALMPWSDQSLVVGCDESIWQFNGDPMAGGQLDLVSHGIGVAWGMPWCKSPDGTLFFTSNRTGIYAMRPNEAPTRVSQQIDDLIQSINTGTHTVRMAWDDRYQGLNVFVTKTASAAAATHYFWEQRTGAWWTDAFATNNHNPLCCTTFDGNALNDRCVVIGSFDGYCRFFSPTALQDDGVDVSSSVVLGPLLTKDMDEVKVKDFLPELGDGSGDVSYAVHLGATAELALSSTAVATGTWGEGRGYNEHIRRSGYALWLKLTSTKRWMMEKVRVRIAKHGKPRGRGV